MPRYRPICENTPKQRVFPVVGVIICIMLAYLCVIYNGFARLYESNSVFALIGGSVFTIITFLLLWSYFECMRIDPGKVPRNWGFYMGDEAKRRRYCKMCNVWKPDRTHHCSACGRCVLNMDHHCPWLNNCIGFWNRKFFIQLLAYAILALSIALVMNTFWFASSFSGGLYEIGILRNNASGLHIPYAFDIKEKINYKSNNNVNSISDITIANIARRLEDDTIYTNNNIYENIYEDVVPKRKLLDENQNGYMYKYEGLKKFFNIQNFALSNGQLGKQQDQNNDSIIDDYQKFGHVGFHPFWGHCDFVNTNGNITLGSIIKCVLLFFIINFWSLISLLSFLGSLIMFIPLSKFVYFHVMLVLNNLTTLETMEQENEKEKKKSKFDIGWKRNLQQVMGSLLWTYFLPIPIQAGNPQGDGVRWRVHYSRIIDDDEDA